MRTFIDNRGATWAVELTVLSFKRTRADFGDLLNPEYFLEKTADPVFLIDLLFALCSDKAKEAGLDADGFAERFSGDRVDEAREALTQEYVDFFPTLERQVSRRVDRRKEIGVAVVFFLHQIRDENRLRFGAERYSFEVADLAPPVGLVGSRHINENFAVAGKIADAH